MCDKLQISKDGSLDLCHSRLAEYHHHHRSQQPNSNSVSSSSSKKHGCYQSKGKNTLPKADSDWSCKSGPRYHRPKQPSKNGSPSYSESKRKNKRQEGQVSPRGGQESSHNADPSSLVSAKSYEVGDGRRKKAPTSLNHLLNFTVAPSSERRSGGGGGAPTFIRHRRRNTSHTYNKEEFLQANCQFVVSTSGDYEVHSSNPDKLVEWDCIEQVRLFCHEIPSCPICLYPPRAAKITRCGHVYCWSCLLHYLSLGDKKWSKCPICNESVYRKDIKSVAALSSTRYRVGDTITMKLMLREKGATEAFPKADWNEKRLKILTIEDGSVNQFVKLLSATPRQVLDLITNPEREALEGQLANLGKDEVSEEAFIVAALEDLKTRESALLHVHEVVHSELEKIIPDFEPKSVSPLPTATPSSTAATWTSFSDEYFEGGFEPPFDEYTDNSSQSVELKGCNTKGPMGSMESLHADEKPLTTPSRSEESLEEVHSSADIKRQSVDILPSNEESKLYTSTDSLNIGDKSPPSNESSPRSCTSQESASGDVTTAQDTKGESLIYFYQASDGQHLYMHPINIKCLAKEYGGIEFCPEEVTAAVVEMEQFTMSEELRGRYKSLSHLPLTCELALCELELRPPLVSRHTLDSFHGEIQRRKQKRVKKKKDERRREKRAEAKNSHTAELSFPVPSAVELTPEKFHDFLSLASSPALVVERQSQPQSPSRASDGAKDNDMGTPPPTTVAPSFAQALQSKSPVCTAKPSPSSSPKEVQSSSSQQQQQQSPPEGNDNDDGGHLVPSFQDAFNKAFETASESVVAAHRAIGGKPGSKTAKKGRKKLVLFSTGGSRGAN